MSTFNNDAPRLVSRDGKVLVDGKRFPSLYRALERGAVHVRNTRADWERVANFRQKGQNEKADRLAKKLIGVTGPPMTAEAKQWLRDYREEHADEIKDRAQRRREVQRRTRELMKPTTGRKRKTRKRRKA